MSSTTIIIKAFEDLKLKGQRFTEMVFGILIVEDIVGIIMMVLLSTLAAASADISTLELIESVMRLLFFLVLWFVLGMYLVPSFFKRAERLMNDETLLVASIGRCLGLGSLRRFYYGFSYRRSTKCRKNRTSRQTGQRSVWSCLLCISRYAC